MRQFTLEEVLNKIRKTISSIKVPTNIEIELDEDAIQNSLDYSEESILVQVFVTVPKKDNKYDYTYIEQVSNNLFDEISEFTVDSVSYSKEVVDDFGVISFSLDKDTLIDFEDPFDVDWDDDYEEDEEDFN